MCVLYVQYTIYALMQYIIKMLRLECRLIYRVPSPDNDLYVRRTGFCEQRREIESSLNILKRLPIYRLWLEIPVRSMRLCREMGFIDKEI
jgi:hypothetical protein